MAMLLVIMAMLLVILPVPRGLPQRPLLLHVLHCQTWLVTTRKRGKEKLVLTLRVIVLRRLRVEGTKQDQDQQSSTRKLHLRLLLKGLPFLIPVYPNLFRLVLFRCAQLPLHRVNHVFVRRLHLAPLHRR